MRYVVSSRLMFSCLVTQREEAQGKRRHVHRSLQCTKQSPPEKPCSLIGSFVQIRFIHITMDETVRFTSIETHDN